MKRLHYLIATAMLTQSLGAHAQIMDLPDPGLEYTPPPIQTPPTPIETTPVAPAYAKYESTQQVYNISRKTGGLVYRLLLKPATSVRKITITANKARLVTHESYLVTTSGQQIKVEKFSTSQLIESGAVSVSETIDYRGPVSTFDIRAESMGGNADITVKVYSDDAKTTLEWQQPNTPEPQVPQAPQPPQTPPTQSPEAPSIGGDFYVGERVLESFESREIRTIKSIKPAKDGKKRLMLLDDGSWYHERHLSKLLSEKNGYSVNESVVESYEDRSIRKIKAISVVKDDGKTKTLYQLDDGTWYSGTWLSKLLSEKGGYSVGEKVVDSYEDKSIQKIKAISVVDDDGKKKTLYQLEDGTWYASRWLNKLLPEKNGFSVGERVIETYEEESVRKILAITFIKEENKVLVLLDDGSWYHISHLKKRK